MIIIHIPMASETQSVRVRGKLHRAFNLGKGGSDEYVRVGKTLPAGVRGEDRESRLIAKRHPGPKLKERG